MELKKKFYFPVLIFSICFIALFCVLSFYNWPQPGDDFGMAVSVRESNFWDIQINTYNNWQGRIVNTFMWSICSILPMEISYKFLPSLIILSYIIGAWYLIGSFFKSSSAKNKILTTSLITACTLAFTFYLHETLYSINAAPYFWCTSLILLASALAVRALNGSRPAFWGCIIVIILNGTVYEQPCIFQGVVAFFAMIYFAAVKDKKRALICCMFWLAAILSFCIMYFAPGTAIRMALYDKGAFFPRLLRAFVVSGAHGLFTAMQFFVKPLVYVFLLFMPLIAKKIPAAKIKLKIWHIVILTALIAPLMQILHGWTMGTGLPERGISLTLWCMLFTWCILFAFFYRGKLTNSERFINFSRKYRYLFLILALLISANFIDAVEALRLGPAYFAESAARVQSINEQKNAGIEDVVITRLENKPPLIYEDVHLYPETGAFAEYYGVKSVLAIPKELTGNSQAIKEIQNGNLKSLTQANISDSWVLYWLGYLSDPIYKNPHGLEMTNKAAQYWHGLAAEKGHPRSMRALSRLIYTSDKSFHGILRALYWYARSQIASIRL